MSFPDDHHDSKLRGQPKGVRTVLQEQKSVWNKYTAVCNEHGTKITGKCALCTKSQTRKDAEQQIALAEAMGQDDAVSTEDTTLVDSGISSSTDEWCCMYHVFSLQEDFQSEKPLVQMIIENAGHVCLVFLPHFHCELNLIEMLWGYAKYRICMLCMRRSAHFISDLQDTGT